ncbi:MAG TPA: hypothetical protein VHX52_06695 [Steroidobacteraceae bacterium]|jgi:hypothetical protein|nr:hypothetical protein [Steroidobacteraceae bacterium]
MLEEALPVPLAGNWDGALLQPIAEINQRMLEMLRAIAGGAGSAVGSAGSEHRLPHLVALLREDWRRLEPRALRRLAACPYLLVDAGFGAPERWERPCTGAVRDLPMYRGYFAGPDGIALVRRTLLLAWHLARANRLSARVLLGMDARSAERIADSRLEDLDALAEGGAPWIIPRWEQQPLVWRQLLRGACGGPDAQLRAVQLRGLQLMAAACGRSRA